VAPRPPLPWRLSCRPGFSRWTAPVPCAGHGSLLRSVHRLHPPPCRSGCHQPYPPSSGRYSACCCVVIPSARLSAADPHPRLSPIPPSLLPLLQQHRLSRQYNRSETQDTPPCQTTQANHHPSPPHTTSLEEALSLASSLVWRTTLRPMQVRTLAFLFSFNNVERKMLLMARTGGGRLTSSKWLGRCFGGFSSSFTPCWC
jgi:hypothetical protein